jgi:hypothetical protein
MILVPLSIEKCLFERLIQFHLCPIWPILPLNLTYEYFEISSATALSEPALYILVTFQVPNPIYIFLRLGRLSNESVQVRGFLWSFVRSLFLRWGFVSPTPKPQTGGPPLVFCPRLLIQYIRSYPSYLEAVFSIRNLRTRHAMLTNVPSNMVFIHLQIYRSGGDYLKLVYLSRSPKFWRPTPPLIPTWSSTESDEHNYAVN